MVTYLHIRAIRQSASAARLSLGQQTYPCWIGRAGLAHQKREGDGKTPVGVWFLDTGFLRKDRLATLPTSVPLIPLRRDMGWCETPVSTQYNRRVRLPFAHAHESMWRDDRAYDVVVPTDYNARPRIRGFGSAIFFHLLREGSSHTAGCVALRLADMRKVLARCTAPVALVVWPSGGGFNALPRKGRFPL